MQVQQLLREATKTLVADGMALLLSGDVDAATALLTEACEQDPTAEQEMAAMLEVEQAEANKAVAIDGTMQRLVALYHGVLPLYTAEQSPGAPSPMYQTGIGPQGLVVYKYKPQPQEAVSVQK